MPHFLSFDRYGNNIAILGLSGHQWIRPGSIAAISELDHGLNDVLRVLEPLDHLVVCRVERLLQGHCRSEALPVHISDQTTVAAKNDLRVVLKANLHDLVVETEQDGVLRSHPLFDHHEKTWFTITLVANSA